MFLLQIPGIPGGPEVLFILAFLLVPVGVLVVAYALIRTLFGSSDDRIAELERRIERLESERDRK